MAPRTLAQALAYAQDEAGHPSQDWTNKCLVFVRSCWGIAARNPSAYADWLACPPQHQHPGGNPADAPPGAALYFKGPGPDGHVDIAGHGGAWSNDLVQPGRIDKVARTAPVTRWGHRYLGWTSQVDGVNLPIDAPEITGTKPRDPAPTRPPTAGTNVEHAITSLDKAKAKATKPARRSALQAALRKLRSLRK